MQIVFNFHCLFKKSMVEISSDVSYGMLDEFLTPNKKEKIPGNVTFRVAAGKKEYDLIRLYQSGEYFFSQKFIDVLSHFIDVSNICYPIDIEGVDNPYYVIYNLPEYPFLNREKAMFDEEPCFYHGEISVPFFTITNTRCFVVTEEVKNHLIKNKISNIYFEESYLCTKAEYAEWKRRHGIIRDY